MKVKVLIVDDHKIYRRGLKLFVESNVKFKVSKEVSNIDELFIELEYAIPDLLFINVRRQNKTQINRLHQLATNFPGIPIVFILINIPEKQFIEFVGNSPYGLLWRESNPDHIFKAINKVLKKEQYFDIPEPEMASKIIEHAYYKHSDLHDFSELSEREQEVFKLFVNGFSYKAIGEKLFISPRTVESHKNNILAKLEMDSLSAMIKYAIKHNLIDV